MTMHLYYLYPSNYVLQLYVIIQMTFFHNNYDN